METLSIPQARKLVLLSQGLPPTRQSGSAPSATLSAIEHLGYIQIDTISVVQRAHHHTLWNRNPRYEASHLDQLVTGKDVFEYWSHAAAYLPMRDFRFSLPRKQAIENHWYERDERLMKSVLKRIAAEGPLMAKDFENSGKHTGGWEAKPTKRALESLFMDGQLMVTRRPNFHKVYDLAERVLPEGIDTSFPDPQEHARYLITGYLRANGIGRPAEISYLRKGTQPLISTTAQEMATGGELMEVRVGNETFYTLPSSLNQLSRPLARSKLKILSPFDNLVIQRKRVETLFAFDYLIECYVPEKKRRFGYFSLPILWDGQLVARMDCKADRKSAQLHIKHLALEPGLSKLDAFAIAFAKELKSFLRFNNCQGVQLHRTTPATFKATLSPMIDELNERG